MPESASLARWLELLESRHPKSIDLGLERVAAVWARMGSPRPAKTIITVAGTNGKGSTVAYISAMLQGLGQRCGTYTSPHLIVFNERVQIQSEMVSDESLVGAFERVDNACDGTSLTYFEFGTLAAIDLMSRADLDFAVLEVGLGGRLDAVNILDADCAVITPIGLDHQEYLGNDREQIGFEKAGILRKGRPLVCTESEPPETVLQKAAQLGCPVWRLGREFSIEEGLGGLTWCREGECIELPVPPLAGPHQANNLATAVAVVCRLLPGSTSKASTMATAISGVKLPGRLQASDHCPRVWLDVGHNAHAAHAVASALKHLEIKPQFCVLGMLKDKDAEAVVAELDSQVGTWCCAGLEGDRGRSGAGLADSVLKASEKSRVRAFPDVKSALEFALDSRRGSDSEGQVCETGDVGDILVFGSFVTVGLATNFLSRRSQNPAIP